MKKIVKYGLKKDNQVIIPERYDYLKQKTNGILVKANDKFGMYAYDGTLVLDTKYESLQMFKNIIIVVKKIKSEKKYGVYDYQGNQILEIKYDTIVQFYDFLIIKLNDKFMIYDLQGNNILKRQYDYIAVLKGKVILVTLNSKNALYDIKLHQLTDFLYDSIEPFKYVLRTKINDKYGVITYDGKIILETKCDYVKLRKKFIIATINSKSGVCDYKGNLLIPVEYDVVRFVNSNSFIVKKAHKEGLFNDLGEKVLECTCDDIIVKSNYIKYCTNGDWKFKNVKGTKFQIL